MIQAWHQGHGRNQPQHQDHQGRDEGSAEPFITGVLVNAHGQGVEIKGAQGKGQRQLLDRVDKHQDSRHQEWSPQQGQLDPSHQGNPIAAQALGRFIDAGGEALEGRIQAPLGYGQKAIDIAPDQQHQRGQAPTTA